MGTKIQQTGNMMTLVATVTTQDALTFSIQPKLNIQDGRKAMTIKKLTSEQEELCYYLISKGADFLADALLIGRVERLSDEEKVQLNTMAQNYRVQKRSELVGRAFDSMALITKSGWGRESETEVLKGWR